MAETQEKPPVRQLEGSETYYVKNHTTGAWGYFTIVTSIGLLQVFSTFGMHTVTFADRWEAPGPDFKWFLMNAGESYTGNCLARTAAHYDNRDRDQAERWAKSVMVYLWPLFIAHLKAELEAEQTPCKP